MFIVDINDIENILKDYHIFSKIIQITELQRYDYENSNSEQKQVRLIIKADLEEFSSLVIRLKNESDVTIELIESQCEFADALSNNGVATPYQYKICDKFAKWYSINGYDVIATVEEFAENEIKTVDEVTARKTGKLLAAMHNISEANNLHIHNGVLFNFFERNELFDFETFSSIKSGLEDKDSVIFDSIVNKYNTYMNILSPLKECKKYAVQGDISNCNLYQNASEEIGVFDFNRSGDNILFCDAVMQAVFEARLMDYPKNKDNDFELKILMSFLEGYCSIRPFSEYEKKFFPYLYSIINAFWSSDIRWDKDSLLNQYKKGDSEGVHRRLIKIHEHLALNDKKLS